MKHNFERFCKCYENIENYEKAKKDDFIGWVCHHRLQTWTSDGKRREVDILAKELKALGMYYNRPAEELIFLTRSKHAKLHNKGRKFSDETRKKMSDVKKDISDETRKKMSDAKKGKNNPHYGKHLSEEHKKKIGEGNKGKHLSEETRKKIGEANKGRLHTEETKNKIRESHKGKKLSEEHKKKLSEASKGNTRNKGRCWFNNGVTEKFCFKCPEGFVFGRLSWKNN